MKVLVSSFVNLFYGLFVQSVAKKTESKIELDFDWNFFYLLKNTVFNTEKVPSFFLISRKMWIHSYI